MGFSPTPPQAPGQQPNTPDPFVPPAPDQTISEKKEIAPQMDVDLAISTLDFTRLGIELRNAVEAGEMTPADIHMWTSRPWLAYKFLVGRISKNIVHDSFLDGLREWNIVGATVAKDEESQAAVHEQWAKEHPKDAAHLQEFVRIMSDRLLGRLSTYEKVQDQLHEQKEIAITDKMFFAAKNMVTEHPAMSFIGGALVFWYMKSNWKSDNALLRVPAHLAAIVAASLGAGAAYGGLRQKLGAEPVEWAADFLEKGVPGGAYLAGPLRTLSATLERSPKLASGANFSVLNYLHDKYALHGMAEEAYFNALCEENPREFLQWYDSVKTWKLTKNGNAPSMPQTLEKAFRLQVRKGLVPEAVGRMNKEEQTNAMLRVTEKTMGALKNVPEANGMDPVAYLQERFVTGEYFTRVYEEWSKEWTAKHGAAGAHTLIAAREYSEEMKKAVAKNPITMLDIFLIHLNEKDMEKLPDYGPGGKSLKEIYENLATLASQTGEVAYEGLGRAINFATIDAPETSKKMYEYLKAKNVDELNRLGITEETVEEWLNDFVKSVQEQVIAVQNGTQESYRFISNSVVWRLLEKNLGIYGEKAGNFIMLKKDAVKEIFEKKLQEIEQYQVAPLPTPDIPEEAPPPAGEVTPLPGDERRPFPG